MFWSLSGGWPAVGLTTVDPVLRRFSKNRAVHDISFQSVPHIDRHGAGAGNLLSAWLLPELNTARLRRDKYKSKRSLI